MPSMIDLTRSYIVFQLAGAAYGVPSEAVRQVEMVENITPVPNAPPFLEGVSLSRGAMIPAVNLRVRFGFERRPTDLQSRLIVIASAGRTVGMIVDSAREFVSVPDDAVQPPPATVTGLSGAYLRGIATVGERLILLVNIEEILKAVDQISLPEEA